MASTKFLSCSLTNDSGVSHMLSTNHCPLIKLFGPKDSKKFTPSSAMIHTISSSDFDSKDINFIPVDKNFMFSIVLVSVTVMVVYPISFPVFIDAVLWFVTKI